MRRGFSLMELMAVLAVVGIMAAAAMFSMSDILQNARRAEQAKAALAQMRKVRSDALAASAGAAIESVPSPSGGVRMTAAVVPRRAGSTQCDDWQTRAESVVVADYDLLDISFPRPDNTLCFDAGGYRLLDVDGATLAPAPLVIDIFPPDASEGASMSVQPSGALGGSFEEGITEGLAATINLPPAPVAEDPSQNIREPRELTPELPVTDPPPPDPTTPAGQPTADTLPPPDGAIPPPPPPPDCVDDAGCPGGFVCVIPPNTCEPEPPSCGSDADCPFVEFGCNTITGQCNKPCNQFLCPNLPSCGGPICQHNECCMVYGCPCV